MPTREERDRSSTSPSTSDPIRVGTLADFPEGRGRAVDVEGKRVAVFRVKGRLHALQDACPHMGASLADGKIDSAGVTCRWHDRRFDLTTGESDNRSGACAKVYEIEVVNEDVFITPRSPNAPAPPDDDWVTFDPDRHLK